MKKGLDIANGDVISDFIKTLNASCSACTKTNSNMSVQYAAAIEAFNKNIGKSVSALLLGLKDSFTVQIPVRALSLNSKEQLKAFLEANRWTCILQDRDFITVTPTCETSVDKASNDMLIYTGKLCSYCNVETEVIDSHEAGRAGNKTKVRRCPKCFATVACHPDSDDGMGAVAPAAIRKLRQETHVVVDSLYKSGLISRSSLYFELAKRLKIPKERCHISCMLEEKQLRSLQRAALDLKKELEKKGM